MKAHKRERELLESRAFDHGYRTAIKGRSNEVCPYTSLIDMRASWMQGWREGRDVFSMARNFH